MNKINKKKQMKGFYMLLDPDDHKRFKVKCTQEEVDMGEVLTEFIKKFNMKGKLILKQI